ncbi:IS3 family transposase, partial [Nitriliruptor alkaliphilus]|uniref:IS3 family transposase n=1 Tax=Nitriliruptor alkaliphilus TaxID=427918 RepID=UPI000A4B3500
NIRGIYRRRGRGCTVRDPAGVPSADLVNRQFVADAPDRLWLTDITEHPTGTGKVYLAAVSDVFSRRIVGWSIADHLRTELPADALQMALWRRQPPGGQTVLHSDHGTQARFKSWAFGRRLRQAGLLGSKGSVGDCYDNSMMESFFGTLQLELLDQHSWESREQLASAIFEWIEGWYNPTRRHTSIGAISPAAFETLHQSVAIAASPTPQPSALPGEAQSRCSGGRACSA